jgi:thiol-disulfide isomerase/thioredoxin
VGKIKKRPTPPSETPTGPVTGAPGIRCFETVHDFGTAWSGASLKHTFVIRNGGDQPLKLATVKTSCGCTAAKNYDRKIAPGGEGKIPVVLNTKKVRNKFTKYVTINSNDPVTPRLRLAITGEVKQYVAVTPRNVSMGHIAEAEPASKVAKLVNNTAETMTLTLDSAQVGVLTAELVALSPGKEYELRVTANPPYEPKLNKGKFILTTGMEKQPTIEVPVSAYVRPRLDLRPEKLVLHSPTRKQQKRLVKFSNTGESPVSVLAAVVNDDRIGVELIEKAPGKDYDVQLIIPEGFEAPRALGQLVLTLSTDDAQAPELTVPITGRVKPKRPAAKLVGKPAPEAEFTTTAGQTVATGGKSGKVTVLDFYASWCGYCRRQIPVVAQVHQKFADNPDVQFVGVSQDTIKEEGVTSKRARTLEQVAEMWAKTEATFGYALDPEAVGKKKFRVNSYPTLLLVDGQGVVQAAHFGAARDLASTLEQEINKLLAGESLVGPSGGRAPGARSTVAKTRLQARSAAERVSDQPAHLTRTNKAPRRTPAESYPEEEDADDQSADGADQGQSTQGSSQGS